MRDSYKAGFLCSSSLCFQPVNEVGFLFLSSMKYCVFQFWCCSKTWFSKICWGLLRLHLFSPWIGNTTDDSEQMYPNYSVMLKNTEILEWKGKNNFSFTQLFTFTQYLPDSVYVWLGIWKWFYFFSSLNFFLFFFLGISIHSSGQKSKFHIQSSISDFFVAYTDEVMLILSFFLP